MAQSLLFGGAGNEGDSLHVPERGYSFRIVDSFRMIDVDKALSPSHRSCATVGLSHPLFSMRLLNTASLEFEEFFGEVGNGIPHYAILSHTWGPDEVSYRDYVDGVGPSRRLGWAKVQDATKLANEEGFQHLWIDTCCIDKSSSAELSEAINSMFKWYRDAAICYAYLSDVTSSEDPMLEGSSFRRSRWFTRGWTLQELLTPKELAFIGSDWVEIGTKRSLGTAVSSTTRIDVKALDKQSWPEYSIAQKMSWAVGRQTTRLEDEAYCLMGLFDVNLPMLYGEGRRAFIRLQQEILRQSNDQSLFTWAFLESEHSYTCLSGLLAPSLEYFKHASRIQLLPYGPGEEYETAFELVHQVVRMKMACADSVESLQLQPVRNEPPVSKVLEARQTRASTLVPAAEISTISMSAPSAPSIPQSTPQDESSRSGDCVDTDECALSIPVITIEAEDEIGTQADCNSSAVAYLDKRVDHNNRADFERSPLQSHLNIQATEEAIITGDSKNSIEEPADLGEVGWNRYIYEPVIVAPLRCQLNGRRLGILFSRDATGAGDGVLSRLHYPSLVALDNLDKLQLTTVTKYIKLTKYIRISTHVERNSQWRPWQLRTWETRPWPEIRISSILTRGYTLRYSAGPNWELDEKTGVLTPKSLYPTHHRANATELAPLALFDSVGSPPPGEQVDLHMFFLSIPICEPEAVICEVGVLRSSRRAPMSPSLESSFQFYSFDLASTRHARAPLRKGKSMITIKYREDMGMSCINVSIGEWASDVGSIPVLSACDETKTPWLSQRLFPVLRSRV